MLNSSKRNQDLLEDDQNSSAHNQNDERVVDSIVIDDSNLSTLAVQDVDSSSVELKNIKPSDVELNDVESVDAETSDIESSHVELVEVKLNAQPIEVASDKVEPSSGESSDVELVEIEPINAEADDIQLNNIEQSSVETSDIELVEVTSDNAKLNDVKPIDAEVDNVESLDNIDPSTVELSDTESNTVKSDDIKLNDRESNDVESKSIKLDSTKLGSVEIIADEAPIAVSSTEHLATTKAMDRMPAHVTTGSSLTPKGRLPKTPVMIANGSRAFVWYALALVVLVIDQWTKWLAETNLSFNEPVSVIEPFLNWTLAYNYGAAFSFLADAGGWQKWFFSGLALVMAIFLTIYLTRAPRQAKLLSFGLALVLGGAVGNLIDRLLHGHVIDFIHVHYANVWHYPIFNIADMAICIGVILIVIDMIFLENKRNS